MIGAQHVDFVGVPVRDLQRADDFYGETLGRYRAVRTRDALGRVEGGVPRPRPSPG